MVLLRCLLGGAHKEHTARASTAKLLWYARNVLYVVRAFELKGCVHGQFLLVCLVVSRGLCIAMPVAILWAAQSPRPQTPNRPPGVALLAELNCRCACEVFVFSWKCELFLWVCMVDGSHKPQKKRRGVFLGD